MAENTFAPEAKKTRSREEIIRFNRLGREWLKALFSLLRTVQFHDPKNRIFDEPIAQLVRATKEIVAAEGQAQFQLIHDQFFLNRLWIKPILSERKTLYDLCDLFKKLGCGGITLRGAASDANWRTFLDVYREPIESENDRIAIFNRKLAERKVENIEYSKTVDVQDPEETELELSPTVYSVAVTYAKALLALREFTQAAQGEEQVMVLRKAQRVVCELVDLSEKVPRLLQLFVTLKSFESYYLHHSVNVMLMSILFCRYLGLGRQEMSDVAMAALFFDAGKIALPNELLNKAEKLTEEERKRIERHPVDTATIFLSLGYLNESITERVLAGYEHHWAKDAPFSYPPVRRTIAQSFTAEIVGLCDRYDALSSDKTYRAGLTPRNAMRVLASEGAKGYYRASLLNSFLRFLGPLPVGTWIELDANTQGLVVASGAYSTNVPFPVMFVPTSLTQAGAGNWLDPKTDTFYKTAKLKPVRPNAALYKQAISEALMAAEFSPLM